MKGAAGMDKQEQTLSIVLVHGAFVDGAGWQAVHALLPGETPRRWLEQLFTSGE